MRILSDEMRLVVLFADRRQPMCLRELALSCGYRVGELCVGLGVSDRYVQEVFGRDVGVAPKQWLRVERMAMAKRLLEEGLRPGEVAERLGFAPGTGFRKEFRMCYGMPPRDFVRLGMAGEKR